MKHLENIRAFIRTLINSDTFHALIVESLPGLGKSTAIDEALLGCGMPFVAVGAYATPLHIYNSICKHPNSVIVLDDVAGLFSDQKAMAILKAATWQSSGQGSNSDNRKPRKISWGSTSEKVEQTAAEFSGKFILLTNSIPAGKETEAFVSRCLSYRIKMTETDIRESLFQAARSVMFYPNPDLATKVVQHIVDRQDTDVMKVNFRTLKMGYDFAQTHPEGWQGLLDHVLPKRTPVVNARTIRAVGKKEESLDAPIIEILRSDLSVKEKEARFVSLTGKSRRTFYLYKKRFGLSRPYRTDV